MRRRNYRRIARRLGGVAVVSAVIGVSMAWLIHLDVPPAPLSPVELRPGPVTAPVASLQETIRPHPPAARREMVATIDPVKAQRELERRLKELDAAVVHQQDTCAAAELVARTLAGERELSYHQLIPPGTVDATESRREAAVAACESAVAHVAYARMAAAHARRVLRTALSAPFRKGEGHGDVRK